MFTKLHLNASGVRRIRVNFREFSQPPSVKMRLSKHEKQYSITIFLKNTRESKRLQTCLHALISTHPSKDECVSHLFYNKPGLKHQILYNTEHLIIVLVHTLWNIFIQHPDCENNLLVFFYIIVRTIGLQTVVVSSHVFL